jgi:hypothetical protein
MTVAGRVMVFQIPGSRLMEQAIRFIESSASKRINHHEWYISKKPRLLYSFSLFSLMVCKYSGGGVPWGMTVPTIEITARVMRVNMVNLSEQKKSQIDRDTVFSLDVTKCSLAIKLLQATCTHEAFTPT